jgi:hypothetical protein
MSVMEATLLLLSSLVVLVVPVGNVEVEVVVRLGIVSLVLTLIVAVVIILWFIVGIYMANHLGLPIKFLCRRIHRPHLNHLLV